MKYMELVKINKVSSGDLILKQSPTVRKTYDKGQSDLGVLALGLNFSGP